MSSNENNPDRQDAPLILVIDDAADTMRLIVKTLQSAGFRTLWAEDGATGLIIAEKYQPDAIVLDVMMPEMDGLEVCREIKSRLDTADIPVLFLTGLDDTDEIITKCYEAGGHDLLTKPFRSVALIARLQVILRERALRDVYKRLATQDPQTGVDNRRQTFLNVSDAIVAARRSQTTSAVIMGDISNLSEVNQRYGYEFGDEIILTFARLMKRLASSECKIGRVAGDTLSIILKNSSRERAVELAQRLGRTFAAIAFDAATKPKHFVANFGIATYEGQEGDFDPDDFMNQADMALNHAKQQPRGGVVGFWDLPPEEQAEIAAGKRRSRKRRRVQTQRTFVAAEPEGAPSAQVERRAEDTLPR